MKRKIYLLGLLFLMAGVSYAQNVGIGTALPASKLSVAGNLSIGSSYAGVSAPANGAIIEGNVGIGTSAPAEKLDVVGNVQFSGALMPGGNPGTAGQVLTSQGPGNPPTWTSIGSGASVCATASSNYLQKWTGSELCNSIVYDDGTNVGIGTSIPEEKLHIVGRVYQTGLGGSTFFGYQAGANDDLSNNFNSAFGYQALLSNTTGSYNSAFGYRSLYFNTTGFGNSAFGYRSFYFNTTGSYNSAFGYRSLFSNTTGYENSAFGYNSLYSNTTGYENSAFGSYSLFSNTTGYENSAFGYRSLYSNTTGYENSAFGYYSLYSNTTGTHNSAFGYYSLRSNTTGDNNSAFGYYSLKSNTTGTHNSAFGYYSFYFNTTGYENSAFGSFSLRSNTTGYRNSAFGNSSLFYNSGGNENVAVGYFAGYGASGVDFNQCTFIGANSYPTFSRTNVTMLGYGITNNECTGDNQMILGNTLITQIRAAVGSITTYSDARFKTNVKEDVVGLDFILKLKPVTFNKDPRILYKIWGTPDSVVERIINEEAIREVQNIRFIGFLAQDVEKAAKECGFDFPGLDVPKNENEVYSLRYVDFIMPIVKAIQELHAMEKELEAKNKELEAKIKEIEKLKAENEAIKAEISRLNSEISAKDAEIENLKSEIKDIKTLLGLRAEK